MAQQFKVGTLGFTSTPFEFNTLCCLDYDLLRQLELTSFLMLAEWEELMLLGQKKCAKYFTFTYLQNCFAFEFIVT